MRHRLSIVVPIAGIALTVVTASAALLDVGDAIAQAFSKPVQSVPLGQCHTVPADTVCVEVPPPEPPAHVSCSVDRADTSATLTWEPGKRADAQLIYHGAGGFGPNLLDAVSGAAKAYELRPALLQHSYYVVASHRIGGTSGPSDIISALCAPAQLFYAGPSGLGASSEFATPAQTPSVQAAGPSTPASVQLAGAEATVGSVLSVATAVEVVPAIPEVRAVQLNWNADGRSVRYAVLRATQSGGPYAPLGETTSASYVDEGVPASVTLYYVVAGIDKLGGESDPTNEIVAPAFVAPLRRTLPPCPQVAEGDARPAATAAAEPPGEPGGIPPSCLPSPRATAAPTPRATATPTAAPTRTATPTLAATPTATATGRLPTVTAVPTPTPVATPAPSSGSGGGGTTPAPTATATPEPTPPAPSPTATAAPTATPQATATPAPTPAPTATPSPTLAPVATAEPTPAPTPAPTAESTPTAGP
jgi:hypothetical protein